MGEPVKSKNNPTNEKHQAGFTLMELILSLSLGLLIMGALVKAFILQQNIFRFQEQNTDALQTCRAAMAMMSNEIMMAGYNPRPGSMLQRNVDTAPDFVGIVYDGTRSQLEIRADLNKNGNIVTEVTGANPDKWKYEENERIVYKLMEDQLKRKTGGGYFQPFAENISSFIFDYLDENGSVAVHPENIRNIKLVLAAKTGKRATGNDFHKVFKVESTIILRN